MTASGGRAGTSGDTCGAAEGFAEKAAGEEKPICRECERREGHWQQKMQQMSEQMCTLKEKKELSMNQVQELTSLAYLRNQVVSSLPTPGALSRALGGGTEATRRSRTATAGTGDPGRRAAGPDSEP